ncbi:hypothetical protein B0H19DRAFT_1083708 [Mycena capillaripes]|nr:hypothetical protein B0H19DRAFT_1083708 [Mycena capillaripes]
MADFPFQSRQNLGPRELPRSILLDVVVRSASDVITHSRALVRVWARHPVNEELGLLQFVAKTSQPVFPPSERRPYTLAWLIGGWASFAPLGGWKRTEESGKSQVLVQEVSQSYGRGQQMREKLWTVRENPGGSEAEGRSKGNQDGGASSACPRLSPCRPRPGRRRRRRRDGQEGGWRTCRWGIARQKKKACGIRSEHEGPQTRRASPASRYGAREEKKKRAALFEGAGLGCSALPRRHRMPGSTRGEQNVRRRGEHHPRPGIVRERAEKKKWRADFEGGGTWVQRALPAAPPHARKRARQGRSSADTGAPLASGNSAPQKNWRAYFEGGRDLGAARAPPNAAACQGAARERAEKKKWRAHLEGGGTWVQRTLPATPPHARKRARQDRSCADAGAPRASGDSAPPKKIGGRILRGGEIWVQRALPPTPPHARERARRVEWAIRTDADAERIASPACGSSARDRAKKKKKLRAHFQGGGIAHSVHSQRRARASGSTRGEVRAPRTRGAPPVSGDSARAHRKKNGGCILSGAGFGCSMRSQRRRRMPGSMRDEQNVRE